MIKFETHDTYHYEHIDLAALCTLINTLVILSGHQGAIVGLPVALCGLAYDLRRGCHINNVVMRLSIIAMNIYFLTL